MTLSRRLRAQILFASLFACIGTCGPAFAVGQSSPLGYDAEAESTRAKAYAEKCARLTCRTETRELQFQLDDGTAVMKTELLPYVDAGTVVLYPGEAIEIDFASDGKTMEPHFGKILDHLEDPKRTSGDTLGPIEPRTDSRANFWLEFRQNGTGMTLKLRSDMGYEVKYRAVMLTPEKNGLMASDTSSCPVIPYGGAYETWPHPIAMIVLSDFRLVTDGNLTCD